MKKIYFVGVVDATEALRDHDYCKHVSEDECCDVVVCAAEALRDHNYCKRKPEDQSCEEPPHKVARTDGRESCEVMADVCFSTESDVNDSLPPDNIPTLLSEQGELFAELMCLFSQSLNKQSNQRNKAYSDAIRKFSVTMYTYSPKAYRLVL